MNEKQSSFFSSSFLSKLNSADFFEIAKDLPDAVLLENTENTTSDNLQLNGAHLLIPSSSFSQLLAEQNFFPANNEDSTATSKIPSVEPFSGVHNLALKIHSDDQINVKKTISWTYSKKLNKLYCCPGVSCPIEISVSSAPPSGSVVRATAVFSKPEHIQSLVQRCENHRKKRQFELSDDLVPDRVLPHFIRCQHKSALYGEDLATTRHSVLVPYEKPPSKGAAFCEIGWVPITRL